MRISLSKVRQTATLPSYQTDGAAGMDLHACIDKDMVVHPFKRTLVPTGVAIALPRGYEAQVRARSGLASKYGIALVNGVGTIDADYRGEVGVLLINFGEDPFTIEPNMRIAQLVIAHYEKIEWVEKDNLDQTTRADGGFGSTGTTEV